MENTEIAVPLSHHYLNPECKDKLNNNGANLLKPKPRPFGLKALQHKC